MTTTQQLTRLLDVGPAAPELDARTRSNGLLYLGLDDAALELVLAGLDALDTDPGPTPDPGALAGVADVQVLAAWIRYQRARQRRDRLRERTDQLHTDFDDVIPPESPHPKADDACP